MLMEEVSWRLAELQRILRRERRATEGHPDNLVFADVANDIAECVFSFLNPRRIVAKIGITAAARMEAGRQEGMRKIVFTCRP